jgi:Ser/Thr protein kinase RdoA (MazF antagonist)
VVGVSGRLDPARVAAALAGRLGLAGATLTGPVDRGELGAIWRLEGDGHRYAVKLAFDPLDPGDLAEPAAFADAAADAGVRTPRVVRGPGGSVLHSVDGHDLVVLEWLDLLPATTDLDPVEVGRLVATLHQVPFTGTRSPHPWYSQPVGRDRWRELVRLTTAAGASFAAALAAHVDELVALEALLDPPPPERTCHRDLWSDNVRGLAGGGVCVFDWDNCGPSTPGEELALALFEFGRAEPARHRAIRDAYEDAGGPGRVRRRADFTMLVATLGHIGEFQLRQWLAAPPGSAARARAEAAVEEFLGLPPHPSFTRADVEQVLDAVT